MRMVLIAVVALFILGGGGTGAYFYFKQPAEASVGETSEHKEAKPKKGKHDEHAQSKFVKLDPLILPIIDERGVSQVVSLVVMLEVGDEEKAKTVEHLSPRLKDAYIQDMYGMLNRKAAFKDGVLQVGEIKQRLNTISARVLGEDVVDDVLFQVVQQRPI